MAKNVNKVVQIEDGGKSVIMMSEIEKVEPIDHVEDYNTPWNTNKIFWIQVPIKCLK